MTPNPSAARGQAQEGKRGKNVQNAWKRKRGEEKKPKSLLSHNKLQQILDIYGK